MACLNAPKIPQISIPGLSLPTSVPGIPAVSGSIPPCCGGSIGGAINPKDFLPPLPIPPGPVVPTAIIVALQTIISELNAVIDYIAIPCPLDGGD